MANNDLHHILLELAERNRQAAFAERDGTVHEVHKDKIRVQIGLDAKGKPVLSPWLHTTTMRGGSRERKFYKKGQNVTVSAKGGDMRQATVEHAHPSNQYQAPDHTYDDDSSGGGGSSGSGGGSGGNVNPEKDTYQLGKLGVTKSRGKDKKHYYDIFMTAEGDEYLDEEKAGGNTTSQKPQQQKKKKSGEPTMKMRVSEEGYITGRVGKDVRFAAHKDGAKVKAGSNFTTVTKDKVIVKAASGDLHCHASGTPYVNKPWVIGSAPDDPVADDNA